MKSNHAIFVAARLLHTWAVLMVVCEIANAQPGSSNTAAPSRTFQFPANGAPAVRQALLLSIDERAFPLRHNLSLFLTKPEVRREPVLAPSASPNAPDNSAAHFNGTVLHENDKFRMWYYALHVIAGSVGVSPVCYAESSDGIRWSRPNLGQVEWRGSRSNNCVALGDDLKKGSNGVSVIRDDEDPRPERRYKMAYGFYDTKLGISRIATAISADGIHWTRLPNDASGTNFAEMASLYKHGGLYVVNAQSWANGEGDRPQGRTGYAWISPDFDRWVPEPAASFKVPEPVIGSGQGLTAERVWGRDGGNYTQVHLGVGAASFGNVAVGLWGMWHNRQPNWGEGGIDCDLGLVVSQDGLHFEEVVKGLPYIRSDESLSDPIPGRNYPTILQQANSLINVGTETWIYHGRWRNADDSKTDQANDYWGAVALARLPRDRWGALTLSGRDHHHSGIKMKGSVSTCPVIIPAGTNPQLTLNGSGLRDLRIEVADEQFRPLPGFEQGTTPTSTNDSFDAEVRWPGHELQELGGKTVRIRVHFNRSDAANPRLYALNLFQKP